MRKVIRNKYFLATLIFILLLVFSERNSIIDRYRYHQEYRNAKQEHEYYKKQVEETRKAYDELFTDKRSLEKFAREKYLMKKPNEDIFVIIDKKKDGEEK